tara:strand:+ start:216 stop:812 length:597 start_codon:yes stop_codon:yes gene_type:complete
MKPNKIKINKIKENTSNPRFIGKDKFKKLVKSLKEFPEMLKLRPIVVDNKNIILGGNMRYKAAVELGMKEIWVLQADELTEKQKQEFVIKDNVGFGEWDWDFLANEWIATDLEEWGLDTWKNIDDIETSDSFSLPDGDKDAFQQQTYILADMQAEQIKNAIAEVKKTEEYKFVETFGNVNVNGNALYLIVMKWVEQRK